MSPWLRPLRPDARVRLFCLPYAGGGVAEFARWRLFLPAEIEVAPISLPGRDGRRAEAPHRRVEPLADAIADALAPALDRPWAIYGHSMGAALAFAVASRLAVAGLRPPAHLFLGARGGPGRPPGPPLRELDDDAFLAALQDRYAAIPPAILADRELLALFLPALRADFEIAETAALEALPAVAAPATVFVGAEDATATPRDAERWRPYVADLTVVKMSGDHFFLKGPNRELLAYIAHRLA